MILIQKNTAKLLKEHYQIDPKITQLLFESGILKESVCRDVLIRHEYFKKLKPKEHQRLRSILSDKYCMSVKAVEKIVFKTD